MTRTPSLARITLTSSAAAVALALGVAVAVAQDARPYEVETIVEGLEHPWGMAFLPDNGHLLVTERPGRLHLVAIDSGEIAEIAGVPEVHARGQGGLLDVALHPDFDAEPWVYLTYAGANADGLSSTYLGRGLLDRDAMELTDWEVLYVVEPHLDSNAHFGSRIVFGADGMLYMTVGDRNSKDFGPDHVSQDTTTEIGSTLRLAPDGTIPDDNPFVGDDAVLDAIFSYGHRNAQAMTVHPETGAIWQAEHGEFNGDEINIVEAGNNHGWPIATFGVHYRTQAPFAVTPPENPDTVDPVFWWEPDHPEGFPPSGMVFYDGDAFPDWRGDLFIGNLAHRYLGRFIVDGRTVEEGGRLLDGQGWRIRDVAVGPQDGFLYVLVDAGDAPLARLVPAGSDS